MRDNCGQCGAPSEEVVVTINGWICDVCDDCARQMVDPLGPALRHCTVGHGHCTAVQTRGRKPKGKP